MNEEEKKQYYLTLKDIQCIDGKMYESFFFRDMYLTVCYVIPPFYTEDEIVRLRTAIREEAMLRLRDAAAPKYDAL